MSRGSRLPNFDFAGFTDPAAAYGSGAGIGDGVPTIGGPFSDSGSGSAAYPITGGVASVNGFGNGLTLGDINKNGNIFLTEVIHLVEIVSKFEAITIKSILSSLIAGLPFETPQWKTLSNNCKRYGINLGFFKDTNLICSFPSEGPILISTDDGALQEIGLGSTKPRECTTGISVTVICSTPQDLQLNLQGMAAKATTPVVTEAGADTKFCTGKTYHRFNSRPKLNMDSTFGPGNSQNVVYATADLGDVTLMAWRLSVVNPNITLQELMTNYTPINNGIKIQSFETLKQDIDSLLTEIFKLINDAAIDIEQFSEGLINGFKNGDAVGFGSVPFTGDNHGEITLNYNFYSLKKINIDSQNINNNKSDLYKLAFDLGFYISYNIFYYFFYSNDGEIINYIKELIQDSIGLGPLPNNQFKDIFTEGLQVGYNAGLKDAYSASKTYLKFIRLQGVINPEENNPIFNDGYMIGYWIGWNFIMKIKGLRLE